MDYQLLTALLKNLLHTDVLALKNAEQLSPLAAYADRYCYNRTLQPLFTLEALTRHVKNAEAGRIYRLKDPFGISINIFRHENHIFLLGPYVTHEFRKALVESVLSKAGYSVSTLNSLRLYYSSMPLVSSVTIGETVAGCLKSLGDATADYPVISVDALIPADVKAQETAEETYDYSVIYKRYGQENRFTHAIESGDLEALNSAYRELLTGNVGSRRYVNAIYQNPMVGCAILRTLARKAAERGGASFIDINEITQRASQKTLSAKSLHDLENANNEMLRELTLAVKKNRETLGAYSMPIRKAMEHIRQNLGQNISLDRLREYAGLSETYLSALFKKETGVTISEYVAGQRCREAAELLTGTEMPIQDIGNHVGYSDNNYFVKVFKKQLGMTPSAYRKSRIQG